jgi:glutathione S-transferase
MKLYGFWRSLATYRVRTALALKGIAAPEVSINILKGAARTTRRSTRRASCPR